MGRTNHGARGGADDSAREAGALERIAAAAAISAGLDPSGARLARCGRVTQVKLPAANAVARVHGPSRAKLARREAQIGVVLDRCGVAAARPVGSAAQPVEVEGHHVTLWGWLDGASGAAGLVDLARAAAELHRLTALAASDAAVPRCQPLAAIAAALDEAASAGAPNADVSLLASLAGGLAGRWEVLAGQDPLGQAILHGDLHRENVVMTPSGPHLVDLELSGAGPRSYDLAALAVAVRRYGESAGGLGRAWEAYGADPTTWRGFSTLCEIYELWVTAWALAHRQDSAPAEAEAEARMARWRTGSSRHWRLR